MFGKFETPDASIVEAVGVLMGGRPPVNGSPPDLVTNELSLSLVNFRQGFPPMLRAAVCDATVQAPVDRLPAVVLHDKGDLLALMWLEDFQRLLNRLRGCPCDQAVPRMRDGVQNESVGA